LEDDIELSYEKKKIDQLSEVIEGVDQFKKNKVLLAMHFSPKKK
jgi:hypothetical protein